MQPILAVTLVSFCTVLAAAAHQPEAAIDTASPTQAAERPAPLPPTNAALVYWRYFEHLREARGIGTFAELAANRLSDLDWVPEGSALIVLERARSQLDGFVRAGRMPKCDWGIEYDRAEEAQTLHVLFAGSAVRLLAADARALAARGDVAGAAERLAACVQLVARVQEPELFQSMVVSVKLTHIAVSECQRLLDRAETTPEIRAVLLEALSSLDAKDPSAMRRALDRLDASLLRIIMASKDAPEPGTFKSGFLKGFLGGITDGIREAWDAPNAEEKLRALANQDGDSLLALMGSLAGQVGSLRPDAIAIEEAVPRLRKRLSE